jgi:thymidylate synthase
MEEQQYLDLIQEVLERGNKEEGRNGAVQVLFGRSMRFSLKDGTIPLLTTKKVAWKTCFQELLWFIGGKTNNQLLKEKNVHIWDANGSREFLDSRSLHHLKEDDLGPVYGHQWRYFNAPYDTCNDDYTGKGVDQLQGVINALKDPSQHTSRRILMSAWNPQQLDEMALPPCHVLAQFYVRDHKYLSCILYQRSGDIGLGVPFNIASYSFLTHMLAHHCGLEAEEFVHFIGNCHIYEEHCEPLKTQLLRTPVEFPKFQWKQNHEKLEDYTLDDIVWTSPYKHYEPIKMKMSA